MSILSNGPYGDDKMTERQRSVVKRLLAKGWLDPWMYHRSVSLGLPLPARIRREKGLGTFRDWHRPTIRVTPTGKILSNLKD